VLAMDRMTCVRWPADSTRLFLHNEAITDKALRQASVAERPVALPPVHPTEGSHPWPHCISPVHKLIRN
jgi:hypothetical protein